MAHACPTGRSAAEFVWGRQYAMFGLARAKKVKRQYEVLYQRMGRWEIDALFDEEVDAVARAESLLANEKLKAEAVKVVAQRNGMNGGIVEEPLFQKLREAAKSKPLQITGDTTPVEPCTELKQFFALDSRLAVGRLLRQFLDKMQVTPTELLHNARLIQKLDNSGNMIMASVQRVAGGQAKAMNVPVKDRVEAIERFVFQARKLAGDFEAERRTLPPFDIEDLTRTRRRINIAVGDGRADHVFLCHLAAMLADVPSIPGKLEAVVSLLGRKNAEGAHDLLEGVMADILAGGESLRDVLGAQPTLHRHINALVDVITGATPEVPLPDGSVMPVVSALVAGGTAPQCRRVLIERVQTAVASNVPLDQNQVEADATLLKSVVDRLTEESGKLLGGEATSQAIAQRRKRQQVAHRQRLGLE